MDEAKPNKRGGARRNSGRITEIADGTRPRTVSLDDMTVRKLKVLGDGNASRGIRVAADRAYKLYQDGKL